MQCPLRVHANLQSAHYGAPSCPQVSAVVSVRAAFRAPPSHLLIAADYKQLEMRLMAQLSADPRLQACLNGNGRDFFVQVASQ